jgi:hypothetical protein
VSPEEILNLTGEVNDSGENCIMMGFKFICFTLYQENKIKKFEMDEE